MQLQAEGEQQQPPWKLNLQAKADNFDLRIKATNAWPAAGNFFQFSLRLKLSLVDISVKLKPETSIWWKPKFFNSKFLLKKKTKKKKKILEKFRMRLANYRAIAARRSFNIIPPRWNALPIKGWKCGISAALIENLALLWKWIYDKHQNGILLLLNNASGRRANIFLYLASLFKNMGSRKLSILLLLLSVAMFSSSIPHYLFVHL